MRLPLHAALPHAEVAVRGLHPDARPTERLVRQGRRDWPRGRRRRRRRAVSTTISIQFKIARASQHVHTDASGVPWAHVGTSERPDAGALRDTASSAMLSYQSVKSPRIRNPESPESTSIMSHCEGWGHANRLFFGSLPVWKSNITARSSCLPARHRCDACSMAWRCRFLTARPSQNGRVIAEK